MSRSDWSKWRDTWPTRQSVGRDELLARREYEFKVANDPSRPKRTRTARRARIALIDLEIARRDAAEARNTAGHAALEIPSTFSEVAASGDSPAEDSDSAGGCAVTPEAAVEAHAEQIDPGMSDYESESAHVLPGVVPGGASLVVEGDSGSPTNEDDPSGSLSPLGSLSEGPSSPTPLVVTERVREGDYLVYGPNGLEKAPKGTETNLQAAAAPISCNDVVIDLRGEPLGRTDTVAALAGGECWSCTTKEADVVRLSADLTQLIEERDAAQERAEAQYELREQYETAYAELLDRVKREPLAKIRASSLPLAMRCGGSQRLLFTRVRHDTESARLGSAVHELLADTARNGRLELVEGVIANRYRVDFDDLGQLYRRGAKALERLCASLGDPDLVEHPMERRIPGESGAAMTGSLDLGWRHGTTLVVVDYKSGRVRSDYSDQTRAYGWLALDLDNDGPAWTAVAVYVAWLREDDPQSAGQPLIVGPTVYTPDELDEWAATVERKAIHWDGQFSIGDHCAYCPIRSSCPAHDSEQRAVVRWALDVPGKPATQGLGDDEVAELRDRAIRLERIAKDAKSATRKAILERGGAGSYRLSERKQNEVDPAKLTAVLLEAGIAAEPHEVLKVKTNSLAGVARAAGIEPRSLWARLHAAGAVTTRQIPVVGRRQSKREIEGEK